MSSAAVAQLDRVLGYEPRGRGFESCQPHHFMRVSEHCSNPIVQLKAICAIELLLRQQKSRSAERLFFVQTGIALSYFENQRVLKIWF